METFTINDFRPGIRQIPSPSNPPGTATTNTFRCVAGADGSLIPAPALVNKIRASSTLANLRGGQTLVSEEYRIGGLFANDPVYSIDANNLTIAGPNQNNTELWLGVEWWDDTATPFRRAVARYHRHRTTPSWETVWTSAVAGTFDPESRPKRCEFGSSRSNSADPDTVGPVVVVWVYAEQARFSPDDATPTTTSSAALPSQTNYPPNKMVCHQNRVVIFPLVSLGTNANTVHPDNEAFYWTQVNNLKVLDPLLTSYTNTVAFVEQPHGYEFARSLSSDQLLLMKRSGGALILQGDLNFFRAIPKPNVISPGLALNQGAVTQIGFVYPQDNGGVWVWEGGDSSRLLSPFMKPDFWRPAMLTPANGTQTTNQWGKSETTCATWGEWVLFPSNWLFDTVNESWWRLYPTGQENWGAGSGSTDMHHWAVDWTGRWVWGAPSGFNTDANCPVLYEFDKQQSSTTYTWQSHPIAPSLSSQIEVEDIVLWTTGNNNAATVDITVTSAENPTGVTRTIQVSNTTFARRSPAKFGVKGTGVQIKLVAKSNSTDPAPTIHALDVEFVPYPYTRR